MLNLIIFKTIKFPFALCYSLQCSKHLNVHCVTRQKVQCAIYREVISFSINFGRECLNLIPHAKFSFAKIWLLAAQFEIRQLNLNGARQILGNAIGRAPKDKVMCRFIFSFIFLKYYLICWKVHFITLFYNRYSKSI